MRFTAVMIFSAVVLTACISASTQLHPVRIVSATYSVDDRTLPCDVTTKVANVCDGLTRCAVTAHRALCPMGDPAPIRQKLLIVEYACGAAGALRAAVADGTVLELTCPK